MTKTYGDIIADMKQMNNDQYDRAKASAVERIKKRLGDRPTRAQFNRELGPLWTVLDALALVVFAAALFVSSTHIIKHMGALSAASYAQFADTVTDGTRVSAAVYANVHQWGYILMSEASMLLFMILFAMLKGWRRWVFFSLAMVATVFVIVANWQSGIGALESIMVPAFTLGIGLHLERLIVRGLRRRHDVTTKYLDALGKWEVGTNEPENHPDYLPTLKQEIWETLTKLKANREYADAPSAVKNAAVAREMARERWVYEDAPSVEDMPVNPTNPGDGETMTTTEPTTTPTANGRHALVTAG